MKESGIINRDIAAAISKLGHGDLLMVADAGFAIPVGVDVVDISLSDNVPLVVDVLTELKKHFSVEKMYLSREVNEVNPSHSKKVSAAIGDHIEMELLEHNDLKALSRDVKAVIRTGDFTAYGNVILVSGAGDRWYLENNNK